MFQPLQSLFQNVPKSTHVSDVRFFVQDWFRDQLKSEAVLCELVERGQLHIRVATPAQKQEVVLLQSDLEDILQDQFSFTVTGWKISVG